MAEELEPQLARDGDLERAKAFWKENGRSITVGVVLGVAGIGGYNSWQWWQKEQGEGGSMLYQNMLREDVSYVAAKELVSDLRADYSRTLYPAMAGLVMAKRAVEESDNAEAKSQLKWVVDNARDEGVVHVARLRLATLMISEQEASEVLSLLDSVESPQFGGRYAELRGDAHVLSGDPVAARAAYNDSLERLPAGATNRALLQLKLDNLGTK